MERAIMWDSDEYEKTYRRIEDMAGVDRTPRLLEQINALAISDYERRLELLVDIGYEPAKHEFWQHVEVFSLSEWSSLLIGIEPMKTDVRHPNPDPFDVLIRTVNVWLSIHRLIGDKLLDIDAEKEQPAIVKSGRDALLNDSYRKADLIAATIAAAIPIPHKLTSVASKKLHHRDGCFEKCQTEGGKSVTRVFQPFWKL